MPRRVVLMRHATAQDRAPSDALRPLTTAGHTEARAMAEALLARGIRASRTVASPARRAFETAEHLSREMDASAPVREPRLYEADLDTLLELVDAYARPGTTVALVGHNPSMADAAAVMSDTPGEWELMGSFFPPASAAVFEVPDEGPLEGACARIWLLRPGA